jgi:hypothetical protein
VKLGLALVMAALVLTLSQAAQNKMSDRDWDFLKGRVQKVVTEHAVLKNHSGSWVEEKRQLYNVATYDNEGNRVRDENYYDGKLTETSDYSFIDGDRVVKVTTVSLPFNGGSAAPLSKSNKPADPRYTYKFVYKYDGGRRTEEDWYRNDGSLFQRFVRVYDDKSRRVELTRNLADGRIPFRDLMTFDDKGNVIEETWLRPGIPEMRWSYSYEFDASGNWIKRTRMKWVKREGKESSEPYDVYYRTITYF